MGYKTLGPGGPPGQTGPTGPTGPVGATGPSNVLDGKTVVSVAAGDFEKLLGYDEAGNAWRAHDPPLFGIVEILGASYTAGGGATNQDYRWSARLAQLLGAREQNRGRGGSTAGRSGSRGWDYVAQKIDPLENSAILPNATPCNLFILDLGMNDLIGGATTLNRTAFKLGFRYILAKRRCGKYWQDTESSIVTASSGVWTTITPTVQAPTDSFDDTMIANSGPSYQRATATASKTITLPSTYNGETVCLFFVVNSATGASSATLSGTAGATGTIDLTGTTQGVANTAVGVVRRITGLSAADAGETIVISRTSGTVNFDGVGFEAPVPPRIYCLSAQRQNPYHAIYGGVTNTDVDSLNNDMQTVIAEFDSEVKYVDLTTTLGGGGTVQNSAAIPNFGADNLHPSPEGHRLIAAAVADRIVADYVSATQAQTRLQRKHASSGSAHLYGRAYRSCVQGIRYNTETAMRWDSGDGLSFLTYFRARASGLHYIVGQITLSNYANAGFRVLRLRLNGASTIASRRIDPVNGNATLGIEMNVSCIWPLKLDDQVDLVVFQTGRGVATPPTVTDNPLSSTATTINLSSTAGLTGGVLDPLFIEEEAIQVGTVASGTQLTGCTRGIGDTTPASHAAGKQAFNGEYVLSSQGGIDVNRAELSMVRVAPQS